MAEHSELKELISNFEFYADSLYSVLKVVHDAGGKSSSLLEDGAAGLKSIVADAVKKDPQNADKIKKVFGVYSKGMAGILSGNASKFSTLLNAYRSLIESHSELCSKHPSVPELDRLKKAVAKHLKLLKDISDAH